jgi:hypothetical protein
MKSRKFKSALLAQSTLRSIRNTRDGVGRHCFLSADSSSSAFKKFLFQPLCSFHKTVSTLHTCLMTTPREEGEGGCDLKRCNAQYDRLLMWHFLLQSQRDCGIIARKDRTREGPGLFVSSKNGYAANVFIRFHCLAAVLFSLSPLAGATATNAPVKELPDGNLQIGLVTVNPKLKTLTFPAAVNMRTGLVEYVLVTGGGKVHESIFKTEAEPFHIHTAMLLLGAKLKTNIDSAIFFDAKREIPGAKLKIEVTLPGPALKTAPIDRFLLNAQDKTSAKQNPIPSWIYSGSRFSDGIFLAQREGSIVSLIADPAALINNPRPDRENDELWSANSAEIPPVDTAVNIQLKLVIQEGPSSKSDVGLPSSKP